ncbi:MAG: SDR family NAD(P)-dependent oxidoreductase [Calditrichaeota bacterium]|nr:MAG: SDR family NAD(P)-dependent oxidoreductase [Calditrichota bacterium]
MEEPSRVFLEVGPGRTLSTLAGMCQAELRKQGNEETFNQLIVPSLRHPDVDQDDTVFLLNTLGRLWMAGVEVDWNKFYENEKRRRIPLPTYPFERQRYWVERQVDVDSQTPSKSIILTKKPDISDWFYVPVWKQSILSEKSSDKEVQDNSCWLVFVDQSEFGKRLIKQLKDDNQNVVTVTAGSEFSRSKNHTFILDPTNREDYENLLKDLAVQGLVPDKILHLWGVTSMNNKPDKFKLLNETQNLGFYSLLYLAQAFGNQNMTDPVNLLVITNGMQNVLGEGVYFPEKATILGPCRVIPKEYSNVSCRSVDIQISELDSPGTDWLIKQIIQEASVNSTDEIVAYRNQFRWVQTWQTVHLNKKEDIPQRLRNNGVYLITGGLGGIGLSLAEYLAETVSAKLVLTARSSLPAKKEWEDWLNTHDDTDRTSERIRKIKKLEELGAEVMIVQADITNYEQMKKAVEQVQERYGTIHGVIHAAGIAGGGAIQLKSSQTASEVLAPKVIGTSVLTSLLDMNKLDFFMLCSSITSILGDFGQSDYCAANAFLDAFAQYNGFKNQPFIFAINWDAWGDVGMAVNTEVPKDILEQRLASLKEGILSSEGVEAFARVLDSNHHQVVVSTRDWLKRIEMTKAVLESRDGKSTYKTAATRFVKSAHSRPKLETEYVAPENEIEVSLAEIWQELFGIDKVGVHDNFFELGGHSLLATGVITRIRDTFQVEINLQSFFDKPTIAELSEIILEKLVEQEDSETLNQILAEIENESQE